MRRSHTAGTLLAFALVPGLTAYACSSGEDATNGGPGAQGGAGGGTTSSSGAGGNLFGDAGGCTPGQSCDDGGGVCAADGTCCAADRICAGACCAAADVCSFQQCATPGATCLDPTDCAPGEYCDFSLGGGTGGGAGSGSGGGCQGGQVLPSGRCLPKPPQCAPGVDPGDPPSCVATCEYHPPTTDFSAVPKAVWGGQVTPPYATDVMMAPIVIELDDDDCDGKVTEKDIPEILFTTFTSGSYGVNGVLHAVSYANGTLADKWSAAGINPSGQLAGGNIDGLPGNEVVACGDGGITYAFRGDGTQLWAVAASCYMPSIADIDGDGSVEVIVDGGILDGASGALEHAFSPPLNTSFVVSDADADGVLDVITATRAYHADGTLFVDTGLTGTWPAVADFDADGAPEVVDIDNNLHTLAVWRYDANQPSHFSLVRAAVDMNTQFPSNPCPVGSWGANHGGGPPTIADFNGDGTPDVGLAGGIGYVVFNGLKLVDAAVAGPATILWSTATTDCSSASTGSSVFDFNGDGHAEVVYSDENHLRVYDGATGGELFSTCNTTGTLIEYPLIADVDNDGQADIVVVSNAYASPYSAEYQCNDGVHIAQSGVRVFSNAGASWVRTRRVWNEHAYHVTNVSEDGTIPQHEAKNYTTPGLNNFRQNKQPGGEFSAPDLVVSVAPHCAGGYGLDARVRNIGQASVPAGVVVGFYAGAAPGGTFLGSATTTTTLYALGSEDVFLPLASVPATNVYAVVDDGNPPHLWHECRTDNNTSTAVSAVCSGPN